MEYETPEEFFKHTARLFKSIDPGILGIPKKHFHNKEVIDKKTKMFVNKQVKIYKERLKTCKERMNIDPIQLNTGNLFLSKNLCELK